MHLLDSGGANVENTQADLLAITILQLAATQRFFLRSLNQRRTHYSPVSVPREVETHCPGTRNSLVRYQG